MPTGQYEVRLFDEVYFAKKNNHARVSFSGGGSAATVTVTLDGYSVTSATVSLGPQVPDSSSSDGPITESIGFIVGLSIGVLVVFLAAGFLIK